MGNLLSRITGRKIRERAYDVGLPSVQALCGASDTDPDVKAHLSTLSALSDNVARKMDSLLIADALDDIVDVLLQVCCSVRCTEWIALTSTAG